MSRRKTDTGKPITVEEASKIEHPVWNDTLRGILVALVKDRRALWDSRFRTTQEKTMLFFRDIATILSNQDKRMNEWAVLEKWCWMMEMFVRAVERPSFEWRFKGAMAFHLESIVNGAQYLDSLAPEVLIDLTVRYAGTEAELFEAQRELSRKFRRGSGMYHAVMAIYHKPLVSNLCVGPARPKVAPKRSRGRRTSISFLPELNKEGIFDVSNTKNGMRSELNSEKKALDQDAALKDVDVKQEISEGHTLTDESAAALATTTAQPLIENTIKLVTDELSMEESQCGASDVVWSTEMICMLIECVKNVPALWHHNHPHYRNSLKRKEYLCEIAAKLRTLPGGATLNEDHVSGKWSILRECFNKQMKKSKQGAVSNWEHYNRLLFLSPEVMSAYRFDDLSGDHQPATLPASSTDVSVDVQNQIQKILGFASDSIKLRDLVKNPLKRPKISMEPNSTKVSANKDTTANVRQVVSTWVPPREDSFDNALHSHSSTPPIATAQVMAKNQLAHTLQCGSPHSNVNGSKMAYHDFAPDQPVRAHEDKWTLMGRMIEETARELEAKRPELAFRLQKDINDVIFKYQLESLNHK